MTFFKSKYGMFFAGFLLIGGYMLVTEHTAHVVQYLPWIILAACPLMHFFMHRGHGGKTHHNSANGEHSEGSNVSEPSKGDGNE